MNIGLTLPERFYRALNDLRSVSDKKSESQSYIYNRYVQIMDYLGTWLWDQAPSAHKVLSVSGREIVLQPDKSNPFNVYWTMEVQEKLSEQYRFGGLWERSINDP